MPGRSAARHSCAPYLDAPITRVLVLWRCTLGCRCTCRGVPPERFTGSIFLHRRVRLAAGTGTSAAPLTRLARTEYIGRRQVVPGTTLADLDDVYPELTVFACHLGKFKRLFYPPFILPKLVAVDVGHMSQLGAAADWAVGVGRLTMELRSPQQIRMGITNIGDRGVPAEHGHERRTPRERVIDYRSP